MNIGLILSNLFAGVSTLFVPPGGNISISIMRIVLIAIGAILIYLGKKEILEPLLMIPMGLGMIAVNAGVLQMVDELGKPFIGTLFVNSLANSTNQVMYYLGVDFLQPIYTFTFSNGLIACLVFMGIGVLLDVGYLISRPFLSMFLALCGELGTILTFPIAVSLGLNFNDAASISMVGGADGPMVLLTSLKLSPKLFAAITIVAYLYLGLTYGGYPYLIKLMIPKKLRAIKMDMTKNMKIVTSGQKLAFAVVTCGLLCLLFPVAAPLFISLFLGVAVREAGLKHFVDLIGGPILYGSTFFLGLMLGVLCEASTILDPVVLKLLLLGILSLLISGIGGILGGYIMYFITGKKFNPTIGIAAVSCVPTTAKVAQKSVSEVAPGNIILPIALGANISGVITTAILAAIYITLVPIWPH